MHNVTQSNLQGILFLVNSKIAFLFFLFITLFFPAKAQILTGIIVDSEQNPVPYATIFVSETKEGTTSNIDGYFNLRLKKGYYNLTIRSMGYEQQKESVRLQNDSLFINIKLKPQNFEIKEVKIFPGKEDPAYYIMRKAMAKAPYYRKKIKHYTADLYIKSNISFSNIPRFIGKQEIENGKKFKDYFKENIVYVIESQNKITYDYPDKYTQKVISKKTSITGFKEPPVVGLLTASFYDERPDDLISPLSSQALRHYNFTYEGFISAGNYDIFKIKVTPKRKSKELVDGYIYITDKLWCIYNLDFDANFGLYEYRIKQQFENLGHGNWLPVSHNFSGNFGIIGLRGDFSYKASVKYDSIQDNFKSAEIDIKQETVSKKERTKNEKEKKYEKQVDALNIKENLTNADVKKSARLSRKILKEQYKDSTIIAPADNSYHFSDNKDSLQNDISWDTVRAIPLTQAEIESYSMADSIKRQESETPDSIKNKQDSHRLLNQIITGGYDLCKDSLIRISYDGLISPTNYDYNAVDGYKYQQELRIRFNPDSAKYIYITPTIGYAFNRKTVFGKLNTRLVNIIAKGNKTTIEIGKLSRDFKKNKTGISPIVNSTSSWFFAENYMKLYESKYLHIYESQKIKKHIRIYGKAEYDQFSQLKNHISFPLSDNKSYSSNIPQGLYVNHPALSGQKSFTWGIGVGYNKKQRKPWLDKSPVLLINDFYSANILFYNGIPDILNSESDFSRIEFNFHQQANISPTAGIDWKITAGHYFNADKLHFSQYKHFNTAETPVMIRTFTHRFQCVNDYEFSTNESYLNIGAEFKSEYLLLRYISLLNQKSWSESLHFNYLTTPDIKNYWETGYSINNLFFVGSAGIFAGFKGSGFEYFRVKLSFELFDQIDM